MADGNLKKVEEVKFGEEVITFDTQKNEYSHSEIECVVITKCHKGRDRYGSINW